MTAEIIAFPDPKPGPRTPTTEPAVVIILPIVRIEHLRAPRPARRRKKKP